MQILKHKKINVMQKWRYDSVAAGRGWILRIWFTL